MNTAMGQALENRDGFVKFLVDNRTRKNPWMSYYWNPSINSYS
jgi:hypothetical protein